MPSDELPRCRVSTSRHVPGDMRLQETVHLKELGMSAAMSVWSGRVKWVFITNLPGYEDPSVNLVYMGQEPNGRP
jgi:hypothetical protein